MLLFLYVPLVPPLASSLAPAGVGEPGPTLRWYRELWRNPLLVGGIQN